MGQQQQQQIKEKIREYFQTKISEKILKLSKIFRTQQKQF